MVPAARNRTAYFCADIILEDIELSQNVVNPLVPSDVADFI